MNIDGVEYVPVSESAAFNYSYGNGNGIENVATMLGQR